MAKTKEIKTKPVKAEKNLTIEEHYNNYWNATTIEEKTKHYHIIDNILKK